MAAKKTSRADEFVLIDGGAGEGGGQILRSSLALSMITGRPTRVQNIRAGRPKPGLMRQHLTAVHAAARICNAAVTGDAIGSADVSFVPGVVKGGEYTFSVGTAGSTGLVLKTVLLPLALAAEPSRLTLEGGTHNPHAPPFEFLERTFTPLLNRMGPQVRLHLEQAGFYPAGGGRLSVEITPTPAFSPLELVDRGEQRSRRARAIVSNLPRRICERELEILRPALSLADEECEIVELRGAGPGNVLMLICEFDALSEVFTGFGAAEKPVSAVAGVVVDEARSYFRKTAPVGAHLADQLLLPLALAGGGRFRTIGLTPHAETQLDLIPRFVDCGFEVERGPSWTEVRVK